MQVQEDPVQEHIKVSRYQQFGAPGSLLEPSDENLYRQGVVGCEVTSNDVPLPLPCGQLKSDNVGPELLDGLHCKPQ